MNLNNYKEKRFHMKTDQIGKNLIALIIELVIVLPLRIIEFIYEGIQESRSRAV